MTHLISSSDAIKSRLDAFERGILVLCLPVCQSKSTLWLNGVCDVSYVVGIFLTLKKSRCYLCYWFLPYMHWNLFFFPPFFLCPFLSRCQKTEGERVNIFTHSPLPPHTYTNSCHIWFCGIWYFEQNDFLIFQSNIIINFTIEDCVHVKPWLPLISNGWGGREKSWRTVLSDKPAIGF